MMFSITSAGRAHSVSVVAKVKFLTVCEDIKEEFEACMPGRRGDCIGVAVIMVLMFLVGCVCDGAVCKAFMSASRLGGIIVMVVVGGVLVGEVSEVVLLWMLSLTQNNMYGKSACLYFMDFISNGFLLTPLHLDSMISPNFFTSPKFFTSLRSYL